MIDLDKLFSDYVTEYVHNNIGKKRAEQIEAEMPDLYEAWLNAANTSLDGATPLGYVADLKQQGKLCDYVARLLDAGVEISDVVGDAFDETDEAGIMDLYNRYTDYRHALLAILKNIGSNNPETEAFFVEIALNSQDEGLSEIAAEALFEGHEGAVEPILDRLNTLSEQKRLMALDILYRYPGHERTLRALLAEFKLGDDVPMYAEFLASFGDERAIPELIEFAKRNSMSKFEFREIRNAVEALGGDMPEYNYDITE